MVNRRFGVIDQVIPGKGVEDHLRQRGIDQQIRLGGAAVTHAVGAADAHGVKGIRQIQHVGNRHLNGPASVLNGGLIVNVVQRHGDSAAVRQITGSAQAQRLHGLLRIQDVILADGVKGEFRRVAAERNAVRRAAGVARRIGHGDRNAVATFTQRANDRGWHADAPAAVRLDDTGKGLAANGHGDNVARRRAVRLAGNNLSLPLLAGVQNVVARDSVDSDHWRCGIDREIGGGGGPVTRFVADVCRQGVLAVSHRLYFTGRKRNGPGAVAAHGRRVIFAVQRDRHNLARFRIGFSGQRQRLIMFSRVDDVVLGDRVDRNRWRSGIDANRLAAGHGVARRVFAADVDRPGTIAQRLRVSSRHLHAPCAVCPYFCGIGFTVQRDGKRRSLRQVFAGAGQRKASGLLAGVDHVIARRGGERHAGIRCRNGYGNTARRGRFTAVDLDDGPGMFPLRLGRKCYRPGAVLCDHGAGDGAAAAVFNLNGRARLPGTAEGWGVIIRDLFCTQHPLLVTRVIRQQKCWRGAFDFFRIINNFCFGFAVTAVSQQCANRTASQRRSGNPAPRRIA